ncbi:ABC transporter ATP-binding protein [Candidatus Fermentibacteria bacterium]|nr:MAG: ABC transporter ATP-binding protein [Candidatus Fermentibacteria bacterium]
MTGSSRRSDLRKLWEDRRLLYRTLSFLKPWLKWHVLGLFLTIISAALALVQPWVSRLLIDRVLIERNTGLLADICLVYLAAVLLGTLVGMASTLLFSWVGQRAGIDLKMALHLKIEQLSVAYTGRKRLGELMAGYTSDVPIMQGLYSSTLSSTVSEVIRFIVVLAVMLTINTRLTLLAVPSIPLFALIIALAGTMLKRASSEVQEKRATFTAVLQEQLAGLRTSAAFNREKEERNRFKVVMDELLRSNIIMTVKGFVLNGGSLLASFTLILVIWLGGQEVIQGRMEVGVLIAFISYFGMLFGPVGSLAGVAAQVLRAMGAAERVFGVMDMEPEVTDKEDAAELEEVIGTVEFRNVSFSYSEGPEVLSGFSMKIQAGETVALSGESGAGKSTVVSLLMRFFAPKSGSILIDGISVEDITAESIRKNIGVVFQDPFLYHDSVAENIRVAKPSASEEEVISAASAACANGFICGLPEGYETIVGDRGSSLSGGQLQRIALARVFLKDPPIVILDEATSALDSASEEQVHRAVKRLLADRTCLIIAHRKSAVETAERIIHLEQVN